MGSLKKYRFACCVISLFFGTTALVNLGGAPMNPKGSASGLIGSSLKLPQEKKEVCPVSNCMEGTSADIDALCGRILEKASITEEQVMTQETELLASIIFCEAGNQSFEGQVAVGAVVLNRMNSAQFPDTMEEVIYQPGQFGPVSTGWLDRVRSTSGYTDSAMRAAQAAMSGENPIGSCLYFDQGGSGRQIGAHYFH